MVKSTKRGGNTENGPTPFCMGDMEGCPTDNASQSHETEWQHCPPTQQTELHAFGHLNAEDAHSEAYHLGHIGTEHQAEVALVGIFLAKDGEVMVELVVLLTRS